MTSYKEIDVCQKCNFLFADLLPEEAPTCPKCHHGRFKEPMFVDGKWQPGRAKCIFRWWPLQTILDAIFMDPQQAQMSRSWEKVDLNERVVKSTDILDSRSWQRSMLNNPDCFEDKRNISVILCADGIEKYKDKLGSVTPMTCQVVNYPAHLRGKKEFMVLWVIIDGKPKDSQLFYNMFVDEILDIETNGCRVWDVIENKPFTVRMKLYKAQACGSTGPGVGRMVPTARTYYPACIAIIKGPVSHKESGSVDAWFRAAGTTSPTNWTS
ncbi:hypothetical protein CYMTET_50536 [Cymbomonas tetramitiformis]|uniref:Uncharacterized protein n=1 Tax=Cymbomonas tetramitiformis TaxID=36881 RepID=A0AAE0BPV6_9CHLO|nr:hypothetical protein CYMTET_50536 [Cymbomonas tetramitiformis]